MGSGADSPCQGEMSRSDRGGRVGDYEHKVLIGANPGGVLPSFSPWKKKVAARRRRNLPAYNERNPKSAPSSVTASPCHLPPMGKVF